MRKNRICAIRKKATLLLVEKHSKEFHTFKNQLNDHHEYEGNI